MKIGILAVQGDYEAHAEVIRRLGIEMGFVRTPSDLQGMSGLILPGGESTSQWKIIAEEDLVDPIRRFAKQGGAVFGTCAGVILLADRVEQPHQDSLGLVEMVVRRNAYGRQVASEVREGKTKLKNEPVEMVFIRAPIIESIGAQVEILAESEGRPVLVRSGKILGATFHPELTEDPTIHEYFLQMARNGSG